MPITFHAELLNTDLDIFVEHYDYALVRDTPALLGELPPRIRFRVFPSKEPPLDYRLNYVIHISKTASWLTADPWLPIRSNQTGQESTIPPYARGVGYSVYAGGQKDAALDEWQPNRQLFALWAMRYQQKRVRLILEEYGDTTEYADRLKRWLSPRWGRAVVERKAKDALALSSVGDYEDRIREAGYRARLATERWLAVIPIYAEWRRADPSRAIHRLLAGIMGCSEAHVKRMWGLHKPDDSAE